MRENRPQAVQSCVAICVRPMGTDLVALTAFDTLVRKMGYRDSLLSLWREEVWILAFCADPPRSRALTELLASGTGIFVNPNTHTHEVVGSDEMMPFGRAQGREDIGISVWSIEDTQVGPVAVAVRERMGIADLIELRHLVMWWIGYAGESPRGGEEDVARAIAVTRSREKGLLANPHSQGWYLFRKAMKPHELLEIIAVSDMV